MTRRSIPREREIEARYHSKCADCAQPIVPGTPILYTPANGIIRPVVRHRPGECVEMYTFKVACIYRSTRHTLSVVAQDAADAIARAEKMCGKGKPVSMPEAYRVFYNNAEVERRVVQ